MDEGTTDGVANLFPDPVAPPPAPNIEVLVERDAAAVARGLPKVITITKSQQHHSLWGNELWNASKCLQRKIDAQEINVEGKSVLELGAGLGLPSIAAAHNGARIVVATDYPEDSLLNMLRLNVSQNCSSNANVKVMPLLWGNRQQLDDVLQLVGGSGFDMIFLSDVVFNHICHHDLLRTVSHALSRERSSVVHVTFSHHRVAKVNEDLSFFSLCREYGLSADKVAEVAFPAMYPQDPGPEEIRGPVHHYKLTLRYDEAGAPLDEDSFDVVVHGSGLTESILAASLSRAGYSVLVSDGSEKYGGCFSTLTPLQMEERVRQLSGGRVHCNSFSAPPPPEQKKTADTKLPETADAPKPAETADAPKPAETADAPKLAETADPPKAPETCEPSPPSQPPAQTGVPSTGTNVEGAAVAECEDATEAQAIRCVRSFALDLLPLTFMARSDLIEMLISSCTASHMEFQNIDRLLEASLNDNELHFHRVPLSRADVFKDNAIGPMEMRKIVTFVNDVNGSLEKLNLKSRTLQEVLENDYKLSPALVRRLTLQGDLVSLDSEADKGIGTIRRFIQSVGRYGGSTPFLVAQFGAAELVENMCRICAVWGGLFVLRRSVSCVSDDGVVLSNGQKIRCKHYISADAPSSAALNQRPAVRGIVVATAPVFSWSELERQCGDVAEDDEDAEIRRNSCVPLVVAHTISSVAHGPLRLVQYGGASRHAPAEGSCCVLHIVGDATGVSQQQLDDSVDSLLRAVQQRNPKFRVLFRCSFVLPAATPTVSVSPNTKVQCHPVAPYNLSMNDGQAVLQAKEIFALIQASTKASRDVPRGASCEGPIGFMEPGPNDICNISLVEDDDDALLLGVQD